MLLTRPEVSCSLPSKTWTFTLVLKFFSPSSSPGLLIHSAIPDCDLWSTILNYLITKLKTASLKAVNFYTADQTL